MTASDIVFRTEKVFIGNIPPTATRSDLQQCLESYGNIVDCVIMTKHDGSGRGFGFCEFEDFRSVERVVENWEKHYIRGQWVEVKQASPENALRKYRPCAGRPRSQRA